MTLQENDRPHKELDLLVQIAESYYIKNKSQSEIAELFGISPSKVSRLLSRARDEGVVRISVVHPRGRNKEFERALYEKFSLKEAIVATGWVDVFDKEEVTYKIGKVAAPYIDELIRPGMVIGVGHSDSVAALISALKPLATPRYITIVQVLGEYDIQHGSSHSAEVNRMMAKMYTGTSYYLNAPTLVEDISVAEALWRSRGVSEVLPFYKRLDMMLVGVGPLHGSPLQANGLLRARHIEQLEAAGAVGDICGHFFAEDGSLVDDAYPGQIIAISWEQLRRCPHVVAVAAGDNKVKALRALLESRIIHMLVTNERTAQLILDL
jgi:DNA-binding transcriptional regulator LsrR (DeoR family)